MKRFELCRRTSNAWELIAVAQEWFYAENERSVGPLSLDALTDALRRMAEPRNTLVWREGLGDWRPASDVPELAGQFDRRTEKGPPVVANPDPKMDRWTSDEPAAEVWDDDELPATWKRRWPYIAAVAILVVIVAAGAIYASRSVRTAGEPEARVALPATPEPTPQPQQPKQEAARQDPAIVLAQLTEKAAQAAAATDALALKLWAAIEPPSMQTPNYATASRSDLEAYFLDLETAEANAAAAQPQYAALLKAERELIEDSARSSGLAESDWSGLLASVDERHRAALELATRMLQARGDFYRALQRMLAVVIDQFGKFKVGADGQLQLSNKVATDRMVAAAEQVSVADKALERIEEQMMKARQVPPQAQEPAWKDMIIKERTGTPQ